MRTTGESFEKLEVWQRSHRLSIDIYRILSECRDWGFRDQITRAANSIADNIAEGAERTSKAEFRQFVGYAKGSAGETRSQILRFAVPLNYMSESDGGRIYEELCQISRMLHGLIKSLEP